MITHQVIFFFAKGTDVLKLTEVLHTSVMCSVFTNVLCKMQNSSLEVFMRQADPHHLSDKHCSLLEEPMSLHFWMLF